MGKDTYDLEEVRDSESGETMRAPEGEEDEHQVQAASPSEARDGLQEQVDEVLGEGAAEVSEIKDLDTGKTTRFD